MGDGRGMQTDEEHGARRPHDDRRQIKRGVDAEGAVQRAETGERKAGELVGIADYPNVTVGWTPGREAGTWSELARKLGADLARDVEVSGDGVDRFRGSPGRRPHRQRPRDDAA